MNPAERDQLCLLYVEALSDAGDVDPLACVAAALPARTPPELAVGQIWRAVRQERPGHALVALTHVGEVTRGVVASTDTFLAATDDVLVSAVDSPTGASLALHVWLDIPIRADALRGFVGVLPTHIIEVTLMLLQRQLTGGFTLRAHASIDEAGPEAVRWSIAPQDARDRAIPFVTGSRVVDSIDGRVAARAALRGAVSWIAEDALAAVSGEEMNRPWHRAFAERLRKVLRELNATFDVSESDFAVASGLGVASAGLLPSSGGMFFAFFSLMPVPTIGAASPLALRQSIGTQDDEAVTFALTVGNVRVAVRAHVRESEIDLLVVARVDGRPRRGLKVSVKIDGKPFGLPRATNREGAVSIAGVAVKPGARVDMEFSHGRIKHLVSVT